MPITTRPPILHVFASPTTNSAARLTANARRIVEQFVPARGGRQRPGNAAEAVRRGADLTRLPHP